MNPPEKITSSGIIYCLTSPSGKRYVGQTRQTLKQRMKGHRSKRSNCILLKRAAGKYGWGTLKVSVLWEGPVGELDAQEVHFIEAHQTLAPKGYNCTTGGESKKTVCEDTKRKISEGNKRAYADGRLSGLAPGWNKGQPRTAATKRKLSEIQSTKEWRKKNKCTRRGSIFVVVSSWNTTWVRISWRVVGPCPKRVCLGDHPTKAKAEAALVKYKEMHPDEFD